MTIRRDGMKRCEICKRENVPLTKHHLIPKLEWRRSSVEEGLREIIAEYNTIEKLRSHPEIVKFVNWIRGKNRVPPSKLSR